MPKDEDPPIVLKFTWDGEPQVINVWELGPKDSRDFRQETGDALLPFIQSSMGGAIDLDLVPALLWLAKRQAGDMTVTVAEIEDGITLRDLQDKWGEDLEADEVDDDPEA